MFIFDYGSYQKDPPTNDIGHNDPNTRRTIVDENFNNIDRFFYRLKDGLSPLRGYNNIISFAFRNHY
jgi:hypothetical protein